jgi:hypothetical protein
VLYTENATVLPEPSVLAGGSIALIALLGRRRWRR